MKKKKWNKILADAGCKNISGRLRQSKCGKTAGYYSRTDL